jgi:hypothetical protein
MKAYVLEDMVKEGLLYIKGLQSKGVVQVKLVLARLACRRYGDTCLSK